MLEPLSNGGSASFIMLVDSQYGGYEGRLVPDEIIRREGASVIPVRLSRTIDVLWIDEKRIALKKITNAPIERILISASQYIIKYQRRTRVTVVLYCSDKENPITFYYDQKGDEPLYLCKRSPDVFELIKFRELPWQQLAEAFIRPHLHTECVTQIHNKSGGTV
jgi:hypothetical protein